MLGTVIIAYIHLNTTYKCTQVHVYVYCTHICIKWIMFVETIISIINNNSYLWYSYSMLFTIRGFVVVVQLLKLCSTLWASVDCSTPGFPVLHDLPEFDQIHVHWVADAIQPSHPVLSSFPSIRVFSNESVNLTGWLHWVSSLHQVAKVLELQLQHPSFQWILRVAFL